MTSVEYTTTKQITHTPEAEYGLSWAPDGKVCTFDCIYCECGFNADHRPKSKLPTHDEVIAALEKRLQDMKANGPSPDVLTFAGNGEPTSHPEFAAIMRDVIRLRNEYFPEAKVSVLSNSTFIHRPEVRDALMSVDNNILKLDLLTSGGQADWATWLAAMNGAKCTLYVTNCNNGTADVQCIMHGTDGVDYIQYYLGIRNIIPSDLNVSYVLDGSHLVFE